jgi:hypothetical protein
MKAGATRRSCGANRGEQSWRSWRWRLGPARRRQELLELLDRLHPTNRGTHGCCRAGSQEAARGNATDDASWSGAADGTRLRVDHRASRAVPPRQAGRHVCGASSERGLQCWQAAAGTHQQAGKFVAAIFARRGGTGSGTNQPGVETSLHAPGDAPEFGSYVGQLGTGHGVQ